MEKIAALFLTVLVASTAAYFGTRDKNAPQTEKTAVQPSATPTPKKDGPFGTYTPPKIPKKNVYSIVMVGDSMTEALGPHGGKMNEFINVLYQSTPGNQRIVIDNYAKSASILGLPDTMRQKMVVADKELEPLIARPFDLILIESFGYNPLSHLGLERGIKKQTEVLDELMWTLTTTHPDAVIVFVATIAPNKATYAQTASTDNTPEALAGRVAQAEERMAYIKNHIAYAKSRNIPLIDVYSKSLTPEGDGDRSNINPNDHIHPSFKGVDFISQEIANFIYENEVLPR